jgi:pyruvate kinase
MRYQEIIARDGLVDQVYHGHIKLIDDLGNVIRGKTNAAPVLSNLRVDRRYPNEKVRVVRQTSSNVNSQMERDFATDRGGYTDG